MSIDKLHEIFETNKLFKLVDIDYTEPAELLFLRQDYIEYKIYRCGEKYVLYKNKQWNEQETWSEFNIEDIYDVNVEGTDMEFLLLPEKCFFLKDDLDEVFEEINLQVKIDSDSYGNKICENWMFFEIAFLDKSIKPYIANKIKKMTAGYKENELNSYEEFMLEIWIKELK